MSTKPIPNQRPVLYATLFTLMVPVARECGYALALHGSMVNDLDVVAVPWTQGAQPAEALVRRLEQEFRLRRYHRPEEDGRRRRFNKPHGRMAYLLLWDAGCSVDLSVMPRLTKP